MAPAGELTGEPLYIHRQSHYLFGRERRVVDVPADHPSCSKQHAVLQYRQSPIWSLEELAAKDPPSLPAVNDRLFHCRRTSKEGIDGMPVEAVRPYLMDLGSTNGTFINNEQLEAQRYYELIEKVKIFKACPSTAAISHVWSRIYMLSVL